MAIAHGASSKAHTDTAATTDFSWSHAAGGGITPDWVLVYVFNYQSSTDNVVGVTYDSVALTAVTGGRAVDAAGEPGSCKAYFKAGGAWASGTVTVAVDTNDSNATSAVAVTGSGTGPEVYTAGIVLLQGDGTWVEQNVDDGSPGTNSLRYAGAFTGLIVPPTVGANTTALQTNDMGSFGSAVGRETTAGQGSRAVGFDSGASSDDRAFVHLAIREAPSGGQARISIAIIGF